jgi:hypothetical protein
MASVSSSREASAASAHERHTTIELDAVAYWVIVPAIYIIFGFLWYYSAKEKLIDDSGTMPAGLVQAYSGTFIKSFPGLNFTWVVLGIIEAISFLAFIASLVMLEFLPSRQKAVLNIALACSMFTFAVLAFGDLLIANNSGVASIFAYFGATVVVLLLVQMLPPRPWFGSGPPA